MNYTSTISQLKLFSPLEEVACYQNSKQYGYFSVLVGYPDGKRQTSYPLEHMPTVLELLDTTKDTWVSQACFYKPNRRVVNLKSIGLAYLDIDCYKLDWALNMTPEQLASRFVQICHFEGVPDPSLIVYSGRGLQPKWFFTSPVPRDGLPRWNALQKELLKRFIPYGADPQARDASRVLRLVETVNTKSNQYCKVVSLNNGQDGTPYRYSFDSFCDLILPYTREELRAMRDARSDTSKIKEKSSWTTEFTIATLNWSRLEDLRLLQQMRSGMLEGKRMLMLFLQMNFLALSKQVTSNTFYKEASQLAHQIDPQWQCNVKDLTSLYTRLEMELKGETVIFHGRKRTPLYTPTNETLINLLDITNDEMRKLRTIISPEIKLERKNKTRIERRRSEGCLSREDYQGRSEARKRRARELYTHGYSIRNIAKEMNLSVGSISRYLNR